MIAEENLSSNHNPNISISNANVLLLIHKLMKQTIPYFKSYIVSNFYQKKNLSEDDFTQIYIEQAQLLIRINDYPFNLNGQYRDIYNLSKGHSDFYFYPNEQNLSTSSLFSGECKRLPSPDKSREKEYVIGNKNNGGIERYKTEKHGKNLNDCGMIGFIEREKPNHWVTTINTWIENLSIADRNWNKDEVLSEIESMTDYCQLKSIVHRKSYDINITHLWIILN